MRLWRWSASTSARGDVSRGRGARAAAEGSSRGRRSRRRGKASGASQNRAAGGRARNTEANQIPCQARGPSAAILPCDVRLRPLFHLLLLRPALRPLLPPAGTGHPPPVALAACALYMPFSRDLSTIPYLFTAQNFASFLSRCL